MIQNINAKHSTILVAEDNDLLRLMASDLLEEHGYTVVEAENADEAIKVLEKRKEEEEVEEKKKRKRKERGRREEK